MQRPVSHSVPESQNSNQKHVLPCFLRNAASSHLPVRNTDSCLEVTLLHLERDVIFWLSHYHVSAAHFPFTGRSRTLESQSKVQMVTKSTCDGTKKARGKETASSFILCNTIADPPKCNIAPAGASEGHQSCTRIVALMNKSFCLLSRERASR
ncbi:uncharacterized protein B0I36DRAFT_153107 [Microdochium trichocladiopsis]|uniref:Uncharacterized protein n=1 Tax=Microdochium trichocladiopsis TaxID=1682393 RepID=A0A9P8XZM8_9PEZI|nr:uncharacterized protein B0I36DRAFT_153107 [Microdochium trichocladiopsis]KAH7026043.1 hypothetical protein B0I36DRAFT_153107 [Microdochium trichocladiopsis]